MSALKRTLEQFMRLGIPIHYNLYKRIEEKIMEEENVTNTVTQQDVDSAITNIEYSTLGRKTTVGVATLYNGFEVTAFSSCVDEKMYSREIGEKLVKERIENKVWELLGFRLQEHLFVVRNSAEILADRMRGDRQAEENQAVSEEESEDTPQPEGEAA
jgi:hypothetical protein